MSGNPAYIAGNLIDIDTIISSSTEDPYYPLDNLIDDRLALVFRFTNSVGGYIEFDLLSARTFDTIAILNLPEASSIIVTAGNSPVPTTVVATPIWQRGGVWADLGSQNVRYVRVTIVFIPTATPQIGIVLLKTRTPLLPYSFQHEYEGGTDEQNLKRSTERGVPWIFNQYSADTLNTSWRVMQDQLNDLRAMHLATGGEQHPFLFIPNQDDPGMIYGRKQAGFRYKRVKAGEPLFDYQMLITGESPGVDIFA